MKNVITISGDPGSGKSTVRNALKEEFEKQGKTVVICSVGDIFRHLAEEKGMSIEEFNRYLQERDCDIDKNIENTIKKFGDKIRNENDSDKIYIIDSRLAWMVIPDSFKVRLTTTDRIAGTRAFEDKTRGEEDRYNSLEEAIEATSKRKQSERERYKELYGVDLSDEENYDLNINTSFVQPSEIVDVITQNMDRKNSNLFVCKTWASQKILLPTQSMKGIKNLKSVDHGIDAVTKSVEQNGYNPTNAVIVVKRDGMFLLSDGHNSAFGAAKAGVNLIPYYVEETDGKEYVSSMEEQIKTLKSILGRMYPNILYDYEEVWRDKKTNELLHTYDMVYPGIYGFKTQNQPGKKGNGGR